MKRSMRMLNAGGDKTLHEWDTETVTAEKLQEIEMEFRYRIVQGFFAADITDKRDVIIKDFDPNADILLMPRVQGG